MSSTSSSASSLNLEGKPYSPHYHTLRAEAQTLPVARNLPRLLDTFKQNNVMILVSETGAGKTTQLPKAILEAGLLAPGKKMALTQNRRLAASECAKRIAEETDTKLGGVVGARYRGVHNVTEGVTRLEVVTDGTLVATARSDPDLRAYSVICVDEAHQHTRPTDLLLGVLKELATKRPNDFKIIIMSATIDVEQFHSFFAGLGCAVAEVSGSSYNVDIKYLPAPAKNPVDSIVDGIMHVHLTGRSGNILVFASGVLHIVEIIQRVRKILDGYRDVAPRFRPGEVGPLDCYPLYSKLPPEYQDDAVYSAAPPPRNGKPGRKLIVATNIAETSITLVGVVHVIDSGKVKISVWNPEDESWALKEQWVSKAVAKQRSGRAGRTRHGVSYRMCTQTGFHTALAEFTVPDMRNGDMLSEVLDILAMGRNPLTFPYMSAPSTEVIIKAFGILSAFQAIKLGTSGLEITPRGKAISMLPVSVHHAVMLLESPRFGCQDAILSLVAMLEATDGGISVFVPQQDDGGKETVRKLRVAYGQPNGDHIMIINIYLAYREACRRRERDSFVKDNCLMGSVLKTADHVRDQLLSYLTKEAKKIWEVGTTPMTSPRFYTQILGVLAASNFLRVAKRVTPLKDVKPKDPILWEIVRHGAEVRIPKFSCQPHATSDWVVFDQYTNEGPDKRKLHMVTPIPLDLIIASQPVAWSRVNLAAGGKVQDDLVKTIAEMTSFTEDYVRRSMPSAPQANQPTQ